MTENEAIIRTLQVLLDRARGILGERGLRMLLDTYLGGGYVASESAKSEFRSALDGSSTAIGDGIAGVVDSSASDTTAESGS